MAWCDSGQSEGTFSRPCAGEALFILCFYSKTSISQSLILPVVPRNRGKRSVMFVNFDCEAMFTQLM